MKKKNYEPKKEEIDEIIRLYDLDTDDAVQLLKITGPNIENIKNYFKSLKHSIIHHYSRTCLRCGRPLKSFQSRLDGYGVNCKRKMEEKVRFQKINLVGVDYAEQRETGDGNQ